MNTEAVHSQSPADADAGSASNGRITDTRRMLIEQRVTNDKPSVGAAYLLCLFLGPLGIHRFYLGKKGTGLIMLLFSITFFGLVISVPWAVLDLFLIPSIVRERVDSLRQRLTLEAI